MPLPVITDAAEIAGALDVARNQLMGRNEDTYVASYYQDGVFLGGQLVRYGDLPESARTQIAAMYGLSDETFTEEFGGIPIYPERVAVAARVAAERLASDMIEVRF
jgi:hypothetical protein